MDIYGKVRNLQGDKWFMPFLYQGQYYDNEVDLCYNRFRYYDCKTGSYILQDPIGLAGGNPTLYGYVLDTNTEVDVFGLNPLVGLDLTNMAREQIKEILFHETDIKFKGQAPGGSRIHWIWTETGNNAIRIDPPDKITTYDHIHLYDVNGNSLDINGSIISSKSEAAHIKIKCT